MENNLNNLIKSNIGVMDALVEGIDKFKEEIDKTLLDIIATDKKKGDCSELFMQQRLITMRAKLMEQDVVKVVTKLSAYYQLAILEKIKLDLDDKTISRLDFMVEGESSFFVVSKGDIMVKDQSLIDSVEKRVRGSKTNHEGYLKGLRESEIYKQEESE